MRKLLFMLGLLTGWAVVSQTSAQLPEPGPDIEKVSPPDSGIEPLAPPQGDTVYSVLEYMPHLMDCKDLDPNVRATCTQDGIMQHLVRHLQYPEMAREMGLEGRVFIRFVVGKTGEVRDVSVLLGVHPLLDQAAVQAVSSLPPFAPGRIDGRPVRVEYKLPVAFKLR